MSMMPELYAQVGEALFDKDWVFPMRRLLDLRVQEAEQIAYHYGRGMPYDMPKGLKPKMRAALEAKVRQCAAALVALGDGDE